MPRSATVIAVDEAKWRDWSPEEQKKQPKRVCSIAGCKGLPKRVKETVSARGPRKHVYCAGHTPE